MAQAFDILVKPNGNQGPTVLVGGYTGTVKVLDKNGNVIDENNRGTTGHEVFNGKGALKYNLSGLADPNAAYIEVDGQKYEITPGQRQTYNFGSSKPVSSSAVSGFTAGSAGGFGTGIGASGGLVNYLGDNYPKFEPISYDPVKVKPIPNSGYDIIDPQEFSENYGDFTTDRFVNNFGTSEKLALKTLETELKGLKMFAPAAASIKRRELSADNLFNQSQRTTQINEVLPDVAAGLKQQTKDAATFASGRFTSEIEDRALETGLRSESADISRSRGFGDNSTAAMKASDLASARERFGIAQYGNELKGVNSQSRQQLELAPTSYSDAGQQIKVTPTVDAGSLQRANTTELTRLNTIDTATGLNSLSQQGQYLDTANTNINQFNTTTKLGADQFNSQLKFNTDTYNSSNSFAAALGKFNYDVQFSNAVAGFQQQGLNQTREDTIRKELTDIYNSNKSDAQKQQDIKNILSGVVVGSKLYNEITGDSLYDDLFGEGDNSAGSNSNTSDSDDADFDLGDGNLDYGNGYTNSDNDYYGGNASPGYDSGADSDYTLNTELDTSSATDSGYDSNPYYRNFQNELRG